MKSNVKIKYGLFLNLKLTFFGNFSALLERETNQD